MNENVLIYGRFFQMCIICEHIRAYISRTNTPRARACQLSSFTVCGQLRRAGY